MTMNDVARILATAYRSGADIDAPEGARYIILSDTLANQMAAALLPPMASLARPVSPLNLTLREGEVPAPGDR